MWTPSVCGCACFWYHRRLLWVGPRFHGTKCTVRFGLRLQVVVLLLGVLAVFVLPLYLATVAYTESAHHAGLRQQASDLLRVIVKTLDAEPPAATSPQVRAERLRVLLSERVPIVRVESNGERTEVRALGFEVPNASGDSASNDGLWVHDTLLDGSTLHAFVATPASVFDKLNPLLVLYMLVSSFALLGGVYYIVTYLIIRPLDRVSLAARNVLSAEHALSLPPASSLEFGDLHNSLRTMTERLRQDEAAQRQKVAEVQAAREELERAQAHLVRSERLASVGQLAAGLAHEIGNPIAAMIGLQDLILHGELPLQQQTEFVARMRKETERINRVLKDLLRFARSEPTVSLQPSVANLRTVIDETLTLLRPQPMFRGLDVTTHLEPDLPLLQANHEILVQILLNLLLNAADACAGEGTIRIVANRVPGVPSHVEVSVEDSGHGVPEELYDTLFDPFVSGKDVGEGTGLGLSVCRSLVEQVALSAGLGAQGVSIDFDRHVRTGARFLVRLPAATSP